MIRRGMTTPGNFRWHDFRVREPHWNTTIRDTTIRVTLVHENYQFKHRKIAKVHTLRAYGLGIEFFHSGFEGLHIKLSQFGFLGLQTKFLHLGLEHSKKIIHLYRY